MKNFLAIMLAAGTAAFGQSGPSAISASQTTARNDNSEPLSRLVTAYSNLDSKDPRELGMKIRSLLRDEYTYFRGSTVLFYQAVLDPASQWTADQSTWVLLHGDIHIGNVGTYQGPGEPGRDIRFGVVDLDETVPGPFQLDLLRAMTAVRMAARASHREWKSDQAARALCENYGRILSGGDPDQQAMTRNPAVAALLRKAAKNEVKKYVSRYVELGPKPRFRTARIKDGVVKDILESLTGEEREQVIHAIGDYFDHGCDSKSRNSFRFENANELRSAVLDVARWTRLESSGSQGVHKYLVLLDKPMKGDDNPLIMELKEEPVPAAAVAGLLHAASGAKRAEEVASAYGRMLDPQPRLLGFTKIGECGFLVLTKDPWGEELEPQDFRIGTEENGAAEAAALLGEVLGQAHRNGLVRNDRANQIPKLLQQLQSLPAILDEQSKQIESQLHRDYEALCKDPKARELAARAEEFIKGSQKEKP